MSTDQLDPGDLLAAAQPWYRRLAEEDGETATWGYAVYYTPSVLEEDEFEIVREHYHRYIEFALRSIGGQLVFPAPRFQLQALEWPQRKATDVTISNDEAQGLSGHFAVFREETRVQRAGGPALFDEKYLDERDADADLERKFQHLRADFRRLRSLPRVNLPRNQRIIKPGSFNSLLAGLLDNVFVVMDEYSAYSWWGIKTADRTWVWAVDPDFDYLQVSSIAGNGLHEQYRGYVRVRLQQLANWFYEARRFQPEVTLRMLWDAARQSKNYAFVSLDPEDFQTQTGDVTLGSALRPRHLRPVHESLRQGYVTHWVV